MTEREHGTRPSSLIDGLSISSLLGQNDRALFIVFCASAATLRTTVKFSAAVSFELIADLEIPVVVTPGNLLRFDGEILRVVSRGSVAEKLAVVSPCIIYKTAYRNVKTTHKSS
jgi:hypothetical protein